MIFTVKRKIGNKSYLKDEDRITANSWEEAERLVPDGCVINGQLIGEIPVTTDELLDIMIDHANKGNNRQSPSD